MPIEIKEISIKADIYPARRPEEPQAGLSAQELERLKKEITREVTREVLQRLQQNAER